MNKQEELLNDYYLSCSSFINVYENYLNGDYKNLRIESAVFDSRLDDLLYSIKVLNNALKKPFYKQFFSKNKPVQNRSYVQMQHLIDYSKEESNNAIKKINNNFLSKYITLKNDLFCRLMDKKFDEYTSESVKHRDFDYFSICEMIYLIIHLNYKAISDIKILYTNRIIKSA